MGPGTNDRVRVNLDTKCWKATIEPFSIENERGEIRISKPFGLGQFGSSQLFLLERGYETLAHREYDFKRHFGEETCSYIAS